ncbi:MAG TPA: hypothetical protein VGW34_07485 [Allosphingosinicella sp.]|nr:hypothetical protein [Allosphingosinicella sp.]
MAYYRLYAVGRANGPRIGVDEIAALDDVQAVRSARQLAGGQAPMELWCGNRKVKSFPAMEQQLA